MEKTGDFISTIQAQFPNAELLKSTEPTQEVLTAEGQCKPFFFLFEVCKIC